MSRHSLLLSLALVPSWIGPVLLASHPARGADFIVNTTADTTDGSCDATPGGCSLRDAVSEANDPLLHPGFDIIQIPASTFPFTLTFGQLVITDAVEIAGAGRDLTIIDAAGNNGERVFDIQSGVEVELRDLTLRGADIRGNTSLTHNKNGGAIRNAGNLTIRRSEISGNKAEFGGGILNQATLTLEDSFLLDNEAVKGSAMGDGGGIWNRGGIDGSVPCSDEPAQCLTARNTIFKRNRAQNHGGALATTFRAELTNCTIHDNEADDAGGIHIQGDEAGVLVLSGGTVSLNEAFGTTSGEGGGGGIWNFDGELWLEGDIVVEDNIAYGEGGGGIKSRGTLTTRSGSLTVRNNTAVDYGGQVGGGPGIGGGLQIGRGSVVDLSNVELTLNKAGRAGGAIYIDVQARVTLTDAEISRNDALLTFGGGIFNRGDLLEIRSSEIFLNDAVKVGGGIYNQNGKTTVETSSIYDNTAEAGGGIGNQAGTVEVSSSTLSINKAFDKGDPELAPNGGAFTNANGSQLTLSNTTLSGNRAEGSGGALHNNSSTVTLIHATLTGNQRGSQPGAFGHEIFNPRGSTLKPTNSIIDGECVGQGAVMSGGGNIYASSGSCVGSDEVDDPMLAGLRHNGGPTRTHAFFADARSNRFSPATDSTLAGPGCLPTDQRGAVRPYDGDGDGAALCDVGAYELPEPDAGLLPIAALGTVLALRRPRRNGGRRLRPGQGC